MDYGALRCKCGEDMRKVTDSRHTKLGRIYRRRECWKCKRRITTLEVERGYLESLEQGIPTDLRRIILLLIEATKKRPAKDRILPQRPKEEGPQEP